jgi:hypothetical protein
MLGGNGTDSSTRVPVYQARVGACGQVLPFAWFLGYPLAWLPSACRAEMRG